MVTVRHESSVTSIGYVPNFRMTPGVSPKLIQMALDMEKAAKAMAYGVMTYIQIEGPDQTAMSMLKIVHEVCSIFQ